MCTYFVVVSTYVFLKTIITTLSYSDRPADSQIYCNSIIIFRPSRFLAVSARRGVRAWISRGGGLARARVWFFLFFWSDGGGDLLKNIYVFFRPTWRAQAARETYAASSANGSPLLCSPGIGQKKIKNRRAAVYFFFFFFIRVRFLYTINISMFFFFLLLYSSDYNIPGLLPNLLEILSTGYRGTAAALLHKQ